MCIRDRIGGDGECLAHQHAVFHLVDQAFQKIQAVAAVAEQHVAHLPVVYEFSVGVVIPAAAEDGEDQKGIVEAGDKLLAVAQLGRIVQHAAECGENVFLTVGHPR